MPDNDHEHSLQPPAGRHGDQARDRTSDQARDRTSDQARDRTSDRTSDISDDELAELQRFARSIREDASAPTTSTSLTADLDQAAMDDLQRFAAEVREGAAGPDQATSNAPLLPHVRPPGSPIASPPRWDPTASVTVPVPEPAGNGQRKHGTLDAPPEPTTVARRAETEQRGPELFRPPVPGTAVRPTPGRWTPPSRTVVNVNTAAAAPPSPHGRLWRRLALVLAAIVLVLAAVLVVVITGDDDGPTETPSITGDSITATSDSDSPAATAATTGGTDG